MFRIQPLAGDLWSIVDERDESVFVGTLGQCEDWLDFYENRQRGEKAGLYRWWSFVRGLFRSQSRLVQPQDPGDKGDQSQEGGPERDSVQ